MVRVSVFWLLLSSQEHEKHRLGTKGRDEGIGSLKGADKRQRGLRKCGIAEWL